MKLQKLELQNYRNIKSAVFEFNGSSFIMGENQIGKTNILEAISFVLDSGKANADIIPYSDLKARVLVKATFDEITIAKEFYNDIQFVRGTSKQENKGRITKYYVNGERVETAKEYNNLICEKLNFKANTTINIVKALSDPFYIGNLCQTSDWKKVRDFLFNNLAKATPNEKIKKDLEELNGDTDALKKKYNAEIKNRTETLKGLRTQLDAYIDCENLIKDESKKEFAELKGVCEKYMKSAQSNLIDCELKLDLLNTYILDQTKSITNTKWQFFELTLKGEEKEKCEPYIVGKKILWHDASKSEQIITGITIAENIKKTLFLGDLPYLIDEGGELSTTTLKTRLNTNSQIICVKVSDNIAEPVIKAI